MKKIILIAAIALGIIGCKKKSDTLPMPLGLIEYNLSLGGEVDIDTESMALRSNTIGTNDLIGVQVYTATTDSSLSALCLWSV